MKTKKLVIYYDPRNGSIFFRPTKIGKDGRFKIKPFDFGRLVLQKITDTGDLLSDGWYE